jgi:hypothetical protein
MATSALDATLSKPQVLVAQQLASSETTQYTVAALNWVRIANATLTNTSGAAVTVSMSLVKTGGTAGASNRVLSAYSLQPGDSTVVVELVGHMLGPGDFISAVAGTASAVAFLLSGMVWS